MAVHARAVFRTPEDLRVHRQRLYRRGAAIFRRHGYRETTLKQLAAACDLSIPALYRYFPSKRDFALYPLSAANRPTAECFERASDDPLVHLRMWLDHAAWERQEFLLALRLAPEISDDGLNEEHRQTFDFHIALLSRLLRSAAAGLSERRADELVETVLALSLGAAVIGTDWTPAEARSRFIRLLMPDLVRSGGELDRLRSAMSAEQPHPAHGPCSIEVASNAGFFAMAPNPLTRRLARP